jgi:hypothetical protein
MSVGITEILQIADALDEVCDLLEKAKEDDGKITFGDALRPAIWGEVFALYREASDAIANLNDIGEEVFDLDTAETVLALNRFVEVGARFLKIFAD